MSEDIFSELEKLNRTGGAVAAIDNLIASLRDQKDYHKLFDALLLKKKHSLGLPLTQPTSLGDVPLPLRDEFEKTYIESAREVGELLLEQSSLPEAWLYLRTIREPEKMARAIEALESAPSDEIVDIALYQGVAPLKGLQFLLASHGTCSSITALDQQFGQLSPEVRSQCAALLVRRLYEDLTMTLQHEVERRQGLTPPANSLRELIAGRDWLFSDDNYHVDVSHLNAVVRFSRALDASSAELKQALQLAEYGSKLSPQYQYAGDPPFDDFYPAHREYFKALLGDGREAALAYFGDKLGADAADPQSQLVALALVELLTRLERHDEAVEVATKYLSDVQDRFGFSLPELCSRAGRYDVLLKLAREKGDVVTYTAALLHQGATATRS
jgi:hypothetical protein